MILPRCHTGYVEWLRGTLRNVHESVRVHLGRAAQRQKSHYDKSHRPHGFKVGEWVWRYYPPHAREKLGFKWIGPYLVTEVKSAVNVRIQKTRDSQPIIVHIDNLKICKSTSDRESWLTESFINAPTNDGDNESSSDSPSMVYDSDSSLSQSQGDSIPFRRKQRNRRRPSYLRDYYVGL